jgi:hypothetical protein
MPVTPRRCAGIMFALALAFPAVAVRIAPASAEPADQPRIVTQIGRTFENLFLFTTNGSGRYGLYQKVEDQTGIAPDGDVVCMLRACFLKLAEIPTAELTDTADLSRVRERFRSVRDAYVAMRRASASDRQPAVAAWQKTVEQLDRCLASRTTC